MEKRYPVSANEVQEFYGRIAHIVESSSGLEPQRAVREWNSQLFEDMRSEAEVLMLMHGQSVSDRYLYGLCSAIAALKEENGGSLPELSWNQYELDKEVQESHLAAEDAAAYEYFGNLENLYLEKFPLTATLMPELGKDLKWRLSAPDIDIVDGFNVGWRRAVRVAMPLFVED